MTGAIRGGRPAKASRALAVLVFASAAALATDQVREEARDGGEIPPDPATVDEDPAIDVEKILSETADKDAYVKSPRCLRLHQIRDTTVLDNRHIVFQTGRDEYFLVQMKHRCPGLERNATIAYSTSASRVCELDQIHAVIRFGPMSERLGPPCAIPSFQQITREQVTALRDSLRKVPAKPDPDS